MRPYSSLTMEEGKSEEAKGAEAKGAEAKTMPHSCLTMKKAKSKEPKASAAKMVRCSCCTMKEGKSKKAKGAVAKMMARIYYLCGTPIHPILTTLIFTLVLILGYQILFCAISTECDSCTLVVLESFNATPESSTSVSQSSDSCTSQLDLNIEAESYPTWTQEIIANCYSTDHNIYLNLKLANPIDSSKLLEKLLGEDTCVISILERFQTLPRVTVYNRLKSSAEGRLQKVEDSEEPFIHQKLDPVIKRSVDSMSSSEAIQLSMTSDAVESKISMEDRNPEFGMEEQISVDTDAGDTEEWQLPKEENSKAPFLHQVLHPVMKRSVESMSSSGAIQSSMSSHSKESKTSMGDRTPEFGMEEHRSVNTDAGDTEGWQLPKEEDSEVPFIHQVLHPMIKRSVKSMSSSGASQSSITSHSLESKTSMEDKNSEMGTRSDKNDNSHATRGTEAQLQKAENSEEPFIHQVLHPMIKRSVKSMSSSGAIQSSITSHSVESKTSMGDRNSEMGTRSDKNDNSHATRGTEVQLQKAEDSEEPFIHQVLHPMIKRSVKSMSSSGEIHSSISSHSMESKTPVGDQNPYLGTNATVNDITADSGAGLKLQKADKFEESSIHQQVHPMMKRSVKSMSSSGEIHSSMSSHSTESKTSLGDQNLELGMNELISINADTDNVMEGQFQRTEDSDEHLIQQVIHPMIKRSVESMSSFGAIQSFIISHSLESKKSMGDRNFEIRKRSDINDNSHASRGTEAQLQKPEGSMEPFILQLLHPIIKRSVQSMSSSGEIHSSMRSHLMDSEMSMEDQNLELNMSALINNDITADSDKQLKLQKAGEFEEPLIHQQVHPMIRRSVESMLGSGTNHSFLNPHLMESKASMEHNPTLDMDALRNDNNDSDYMNVSKIITIFDTSKINNDSGVFQENNNSKVSVPKNVTHIPEGMATNESIMVPEKKSSNLTDDLITTIHDIQTTSPPSARSIYQYAMKDYSQYQDTEINSASEIHSSTIDIDRNSTDTLSNVNNNGYLLDPYKVKVNPPIPVQNAKPIGNNTLPNKFFNIDPMSDKNISNESAADLMVLNNKATLNDKDIQADNILDRKPQLSKATNPLNVQSSGSKVQNNFSIESKAQQDMGKGKKSETDINPEHRGDVAIHIPDLYSRDFGEIKPNDNKIITYYADKEDFEESLSDKYNASDKSNDGKAYLNIEPNVHNVHGKWKNYNGFELEKIPSQAKSDLHPSRWHEEDQGYYRLHQPNEHQEQQLPPLQPNEHKEPQTPPRQPNEHQEQQLPPRQPNEHKEPQSPPRQPNEHQEQQLPPRQPNEDQQSQLPPRQPNEHQYPPRQPIEHQEHQSLPHQPNKHQDQSPSWNIGHQGHPRQNIGNQESPHKHSVHQESNSAPQQNQHQESNSARQKNEHKETSHYRQHNDNQKIYPFHQHNKHQEPESPRQHNENQEPEFPRRQNENQEPQPFPQQNEDRELQPTYQHKEHQKPQPSRQTNDNQKFYPLRQHNEHQKPQLPRQQNENPEPPLPRQQNENQEFEPPRQYKEHQKPQPSRQHNERQELNSPRQQNERQESSSHRQHNDDQKIYSSPQHNEYQKPQLPHEHNENQEPQLPRQQNGNQEPQPQPPPQQNKKQESQSLRQHNDNQGSHPPRQHNAYPNSNPLRGQDEHQEHASFYNTLAGNKSITHKGIEYKNISVGVSTIDNQAEKLNSSYSFISDKSLKEIPASQPDSSVNTSLNREQNGTVLTGYDILKEAQNPQTQEIISNVTKSESKNSNFTGNHGVQNPELLKNVEDTQNIKIQETIGTNDTKSKSHTSNFNNGEKTESQETLKEISNSKIQESIETTDAKSSSPKSNATGQEAIKEIQNSKIQETIETNDGKSRSESLNSAQNLGAQIEEMLKKVDVQNPKIQAAIATSYEHSRDQNLSPTKNHDTEHQGLDKAAVASIVKQEHGELVSSSRPKNIS